MKRAILNLLKIVAGIAGVVAIFVPFGTFDQLLIFFGAVAVAIICFIASSLLDDEPKNSGYWPPKPNE